MPTHKELLESLRDGFEQLELFDSSDLNSLRDRGRMRIGKVFGEGSPYIERLSNIQFRRAGGSVAIVSSFGRSSGESAADREARERAWLSGQRQSISLMDTMLEDLELSGPEQEEQEEAEEDLILPTSDRVFVAHGRDEGIRSPGVNYAGFRARHLA